MLSLNKISREFDDVIRKRGEDYYSHKRVEILKIKNGKEAHFLVKGSSNYDVRLMLSPDQNSLHMSCNCPYFEGGANCKHLWAAVLRANEFAFFGRSDILESAKLHRQAVSGKPQKTDWKSAFEKIAGLDINYSGLSGRHRPQGPKNQRQCGFGIDLDHLFDTGPFYLQFLAREQVQEGTFGPLKVTAINHEDIAKFYDDYDQSILRALLGPRPENQGYYYSNQRRDSVPLENAMLWPLLQELGKSEKLFTWRKSKGFSPLAVNPAPAQWQLKLSKEASQYILTCEFLQEGLRVPADSSAIYRAPFLISQNHLSLVTSKNADSWVALFQTQPEIQIPAGDIDEFLAFYFKSSETPELELPQHLKLNRAKGFSKVRIEIDNDRSSKRYQARCRFQYGEEFVDFVDSREQVFSKSTRTIYQRDIEKEEQEFAKIPEVFHGRYDENEIIISEYAFTDFIEKMFSFGWEVVAFQKPVTTNQNYKAFVASGMDWFDLSVDFEFASGLTLGLPELLRNLKSGEKFVSLADGSLGYMNTAWVDKFSKLADGAKFVGDKIRLSKVQALFLGASLAENEHFHSDRKFQTFQKLITGFNNAKALGVDKKFVGELRPYQLEGFNWLHRMSQNHVGAVLADDMGLGKTIQVLALLSREKNVKALIVAPKSLVFNWESETKKFTPGLKTHVHAGLGRRERAADMQNANLVITTYQTLRMDIEFLAKKHFDFFILDEAHFIKNAESQAHLACKMIQASKKIALSGTPVENSLSDLFSILSVTTPGLVSEKVAARYAKETDPENLKELALALRPFVLRRTKEQVLKDLPAKTEQILYCELSDVERKKYNELRKHYWENLSGKIQTKGFENSKIEVLEALLRLRQASCHPGLLDPKGANAPSAKFEILLEQMQTAIAEGHKVLVFSQFTSLLSLLESSLKSHKISYEYLDGKTHNRSERVRNFQERRDISVFLLSLKAGGVGLNLTSADYVYILDPWWNPAAEAQAIDRAHRIGQKNKVFAYKLIAKNTVEEKILALQESKKNLAKAMISSEQGFLKGLKFEELRELFD